MINEAEQWTVHRTPSTVHFLLASEQMRRGFSIFLILFFGLGPLSAFVHGSEDASLPPCCRRHGAHHCAMNMRMAALMHLLQDPKPHFDAPSTCPVYPGPAIAILAPAHALTVARTSVREVHLRTLARIFAHDAAYSTPLRAYAGRGPPASTLS